jgi:hypothetical protein
MKDSYAFIVSKSIEKKILLINRPSHQTIFQL